MAIKVTCSGCHTRFSVAEKFAGQTGPCPKCKAKITIPKPEEEVVIHAPEHEAGAIGVSGRHVLKTYKRKDTKFHPLIFTAVIGLVLVGLLIALVLRTVEHQPNEVVRILAAFVMGPPLAWAGYTFLRDPELEAYVGASVAIRSVACGLTYALLWGVYVFLGSYIGGPDAFTTGMEIYQLVILVAMVLGIGTFAAYVAFDLDPGSGFFHTALYFAATILLRVVAGLNVLPGLGTGS